MCIRILGASNWKYAHIGEVIITMVKEAFRNMPFKNLEVVRAIVVCICKTFKHKNGTTMQFDDNVAIVINQKGNCKGTCVFGPVAQELWKSNFTIIVSLVPELL